MRGGNETPYDATAEFHIALLAERDSVPLLIRQIGKKLHNFGVLHQHLEFKYDAAVPACTQQYVHATGIFHK